MRSNESGKRGGKETGDTALNGERKKLGRSDGETASLELLDSMFRCIFGPENGTRRRLTSMPNLAATYTAQPVKLALVPSTAFGKSGEHVRVVTHRKKELECFLADRLGENNWRVFSQAITDYRLYGRGLLLCFEHAAKRLRLLAQNTSMNLEQVLSGMGLV